MFRPLNVFTWLDLIIVIDSFDGSYSDIDFYYFFYDFCGCYVILPHTFRHENKMSLTSNMNFIGNHFTIS